VNPKLLLSDIASINECSLQYVHKLIKENQIPILKESNRTYIQSPAVKKILKHKINKSVISVQTVKGGVGKTTICLSLGIRFSLLGARVLFIDLDQQANLTSTLGKRHPKYVMLDILEKKINPKEAILNIRENLDLLPSSIRNATLNQYMIAYSLREEKAFTSIINEIKDDYDIIIFDCPPAIGAPVNAATIASDMVIAPLDPDDYAIDGIQYCFKEVTRIKEEYGLKIDFKILLNKYDARTILSSKVIAQLQENDVYNGCLFQSIIGVSQEFAKSKINKESIFDSLRQGKSCKDIDSLAREVLGWPLTKEEEN